MEFRVLVAYASAYGSTQEVAETVAATLREHGQTVDLQPVRNVQTLEGYGAVVLGALVFAGIRSGGSKEKVRVHVETVGRRDITQSIKAPGQVHARSNCVLLPALSRGDT